MITKPRLPERRAVPILALTAMIALAGGLAVDAASAAARTVDAQQELSENWSGYVVDSSAGKSFSSVTGSWTQPGVSPTFGKRYSAFWVGIGGASDQSQAVEQVGTSANAVNGQTKYYAWYELVPAPETRLDLAVHPGDQITGKVTVDGTNVTVSLSDKTTGQSFNKTAPMSNPDTSSAEWIAEAPSTPTQSGGLQTLPLANFGTVNFSNASATAGGHTGSISDPQWTVRQLQLSPAASTEPPGAGGILPSPGVGSVPDQSAGGASPSGLSSDGSAFSVSYTANGSTAQP